MNKIVPNIFLCVLFVSIFSCKKQGFLEQTVTSDLTESAVFADSARTVAFLTDIYTGIGFASDPNRFGNGGLDAACDESRPQISTDITTTVQFASGTIAPGIVATDAWSIPYSNIRKVNLLFKHFPGVPMRAAQKKIYQAEARFLRAWYYSILLNHYGGVPLIKDTVYTFTDFIPAKRNTYKECVDYIVSECDAAGLDLQDRRIGGDYGRIGKGACLALKARVLLYAASPLFNNPSGVSNPLLGYDTYNKERWRLARDAAKAVTDLSPTNALKFSLHEASASAPTPIPPGYGFYELFTLRVNNEYILARMGGGVRYLESLWQPVSRDGAKAGFPYQELVDAFGMSNGKNIGDAGAGYDPANPYINRDPRLAYTVIRDQTVLINRGGVRSAVNIYLLGNRQPSSQDAIYAGTPTGYYVNKMLNASIAANDINGSNRVLPLIRFAEILLNFAEAENEYTGPNGDVYNAVNAVRKRAGLVPFELPLGLNQNQMRVAIQNERQKELAFEGHRFWDTRRWKIAPQVLGKGMHGMEVTRDGVQPAVYKQVLVDTHVFKDAMYFWPIPQIETGRSPELIQNPGY